MFNPNRSSLYDGCPDPGLDSEETRENRIAMQVSRDKFSMARELVVSQGLEPEVAYERVDRLYKIAGDRSET